MEKDVYVVEVKAMFFDERTGEITLKLQNPIGGKDTLMLAKEVAEDIYVLVDERRMRTTHLYL